MLKRKNIVKMLGIGSLCLFLLGCSEESFLVQEESSTVILDEVVLSQKEDEKLEILQNEDNAQKTAAIADVEQGAGENNKQIQKNENDVIAESLNEAGEIAVHICGAVNQPGVYYLKENQRMYEGIQKAGGFREDADQDYLNQALILEDGMKVIVPTKEETRQIQISNGDFDQTGETSTANGMPFVQTGDFSEAAASSESLIQKEDFSGENKTENASGKVDLNTADEALLCTLPGIGENRAKSIIAYRNENGPFEKTEDIMKVSGIKEAAYAKIKDYITVSK